MSDRRERANANSMTRPEGRHGLLRVVDHSVRVRLSLALVLCTGFTLLVSVTSVVRFAYRSPELHLAVEVAGGLVTLIAAVLCHGRFRRTYQLRDLLVVAALTAFAISNLCFAVVASLLGETGAIATWAPVVGRVAATALFAAGALLPLRTLSCPDRDARRMLGATVAGLALAGALVALLGDRLPEAVAPGLSPESSARPRVVGHPVVLGIQIVVMALFAVAAAAFARRAEREDDKLLEWFAVGAVLAAFARLNYFLFPSLYTEWFYAGDVLRLGFFVALLVGGLGEIRAGGTALAATAVSDERRRIARDLHDGMAQDLAFIVQQSRRLARRPDAPRGMPDILTAAERALQDSRNAISALTRPTDEPLPEALERAAAEVAGREGAQVRLRADADFQVPDATREALLRIVREAAANAVRHGRARVVTVELGRPPGIHLRIADDGGGFDPSHPRGAGHFGLGGMQDRAQALGGALSIRSAPGHGTEVLVELP